jgi:hypothetical protein
MEVETVVETEFVEKTRMKTSKVQVMLVMERRRVGNTKRRRDVGKTFVGGATS